MVPSIAGVRCSADYYGDQDPAQKGTKPTDHWFHGEDTPLLPFGRLAYPEGKESSFRRRVTLSHVAYICIHASPHSAFQSLCLKGDCCPPIGSSSGVGDAAPSPILMLLTLISLIMGRMTLSCLFVCRSREASFTFRPSASDDRGPKADGPCTGARKDQREWKTTRILFMGGTNDSP